MRQVALAFALLRLGRPHFLAGGVILYNLGAAVALSLGVQLRLPALIWGQLTITAVQWMTHYSNDYFDLSSDLANVTPTHYSGGSRILVQGRLPPQVALLAAGLLGASALGAGLVLALVVGTGPLTLPVVLLALMLAWCYSALPLRLVSRGLGELVVCFLVPVLTPLFGYYQQTGRLGLPPLLAAGPLVCLQLAMLLGVEYPDARGDAAVGKRTLVVRLGPERAARLHVAALIAAYAVLVPAVALGLPFLVAVSVLIGAPLAAWQARCLWNRAWCRPESWEGTAARGVLLLAGTAAAELIAFLWLAASQPG